MSLPAAGPVLAERPIPAGRVYSGSTLAGRAPLGAHLKRASDLLISSVMSISLAPLMIMVTLIICITMGRPIFFSHERVGFNGRRFRCYKFRTMVKDCKERLALHLRSNPEARDEWESTHKLRDDPRITGIGQLLRKSSLDELPQLINILRGDMSCVGPRPVTADELRERYGTSARHYLSARPGLTGLWQVSGRSSISYRYRIALDRTYVTSWSIWLDAKILLRTGPAIFRVRESA
jgi:exopolysaccharide production protein ExoY